MNGAATGPTSLVGDARILRLHLKRQHGIRRDRRVEAEAAQPVQVVAPVGESGAVESLEALAEFTAHAQPRRHDLVRAIGKRRLRDRDLRRRRRDDACVVCAGDGGATLCAPAPRRQRLP